MTGTLGQYDLPSRQDIVDQTMVDSWIGIRYADVDARFTVARPATGRLSVDRLAEVPVFSQSPSRLASFMGSGRPNPQSEDAFFLNVWAPHGASDLPVMFFIHGGAWMTGGGSQEWYDGSRLASCGTVVVTVNYRLGPLGHLGDHSTAALPLPVEDLFLALRWVQDNIRLHGGDADRVTVVGQSAGGWYGHLLSVLQQTRGMIHQVAHLSMGTRLPWTTSHQRAVNRSARDAVRPESLSRIDIAQLLRAGGQALQSNAVSAEETPLAHAPAGYLPVQTSDMPTGLFDATWSAAAVHARGVYIRWTADESAAFFWNSEKHLQATQAAVDEELAGRQPADLPPQLIRDGRFDGEASGLSPYRQLVAASSWDQFQQFPADYARELRAAGVHVQSEIFSHTSPLPHLHSAHCYDLPFQFGTASSWEDAPMLHGVSTEDFEETSATTISSLADFVCRPQ